MLKAHAEHFYLTDNCNCAETLLMAANAEYGLGLTEEACKLMGGFGGGMGCGANCGALLGAVAALGMMKMGRRAHETEGFKEQCAALAETFREKLGHLDCAVLKPQYATEEQRCIAVVRAACDLLEEQLKEQV